MSERQLTNNNTNAEIDWSAYPLIRLDQIHLIDTAKLNDTLRDSLNLRDEMMKEVDSYPSNYNDSLPPLLQYILNQIEEIQCCLGLKVGMKELSNVSNRCVSMPNLNLTENPILHEDNGLQLSNTSAKLLANVHLSRRTRKYQDDTTISLETTSKPSRRAIEAVHKNFGSVFMVAATERKKRFYPKKAVVESFEEIANRERLERRKVAMKNLLERKEKRELELKKIAEKKKLKELNRNPQIQAFDIKQSTNYPKVHHDRASRKYSSSNDSNDIIIETKDNYSDDTISSDSEAISGGDDSDLDIDQNDVNSLVIFLEEETKQHDVKLGNEIPLTVDIANQELKEDESSTIVILHSISVPSDTNETKTLPTKVEIHQSCETIFKVSEPSIESNAFKIDEYEEPIVAMTSPEKSSLEFDTFTNQTSIERNDPTSHNDKSLHIYDQVVSDMPLIPVTPLLISIKHLEDSKLNVVQLEDCSSVNDNEYEVSSNLLVLAENMIPHFDNLKQNLIQPIDPIINTNNEKEDKESSHEVVVVENGILNSNPPMPNLIEQVDGSPIQSKQESSSLLVSIGNDTVTIEPSTNISELIDNDFTWRCQSSINVVVKGTSNLPNDLSDDNKKLPNRPLLSSKYPNFGMIFPAGFQFSSDKKHGSVSARVLLESMQVQAKLYNDWISTMGDYATVFSEERGFDSLSSKNNVSSVVYNSSTRGLHYRVISPRPEVSNIITDVLQSLPTHWEELPPGLGLGVSWNLLWTWSKPHVDISHLVVWQKINHYEGSKHLTRKDLLKKSLQRYTCNTSSDFFEIMPQTFLLPHEYTQFVSSFTKVTNQYENLWILKPIGLSRGRGITIINSIDGVTYNKSSVIQKYIEKPLLLNGYKFDLRLYVLVTSFNPLEAFIYSDGFARLSTMLYSDSKEDIDNKFIHLTNSSIQKYNTDNIDKNNPLNEESEQVGGSKLSLQGVLGLWEKLQAKGIDVHELWRKICLLVVKSLVAVEEKIPHNPCYFEIFGYDVIIDSNLRPWLLEVNASPSLSRENNLDNKIKEAMIRDAILLIDPIPFDRAQLANVLNRRLLQISSKKTITNSQNRNEKHDELESDLTLILGESYNKIRSIGEMPKHLGKYERLCPGPLHEHVGTFRNKIIKPLI